MHLAQRLLDIGSLGIVYPSVRRKHGTCLACFRPALVMNVRKGHTYRLVWPRKPTPKCQSSEKRRLNARHIARARLSRM
jgi:hypothetical protein